MARFEDNQSKARERIVAHRRSEASRPAPAVVRPVRKRAAPRRQATTPGPRRQAVSWLASGRIISLGLLVVSLLGVGYLFTNARFTVRDVQVTGAEVLSAQQIIELADAKNLSIWYLDTGKIVEQLKSSAYIQDASASIALPDKLMISVVERHPELRWSNNGAQYLVDSAGRVLGVAAASGTFTNTLVIDDRSARTLKPNDTVDADALTLARALALRLTPETGVKPLSISWAEDRGIFVLAPDNKTIIFGTSERLDEKLTVLDMLLKDGTPFMFLDLRPKTPYYRNESS